MANALERCNTKEGIDERKCKFSLLQFYSFSLEVFKMIVH